MSEANPLDASSSETRKRLLEVAGEVFAEHGFHHATVRQICDRAGANVAAINYHFGDKSKLYREVLQLAHCCAVQQYPEGSGLPSDAPAENRLRAVIHSFLLRLLDEGRPAWQGKLMAREMVEPTGALDKIIDQGIRPQFERLTKVLAELAGPALNRDELRRCAASIVGQCLFYRHAQPVIARTDPELRYNAEGLATLADHIAEFSLEGLRGMARSRGKRGAA